MTERERFEKWADEQRIDAQNRRAYRTGWQAALSTRKPCGYGVVDCDGEVVTQLYGEEKKDYIDDLTTRWNAIPKRVPGHPFKTVLLFYEDQS